MGMLPEAQQDWIVTVAIKKDGDDDEEYRQVTYAAAVADSIQAVQLTIEDSGANAPMLNFPLDLKCCKDSA
ncbi:MULTISPECIES: hypothetical protein [Bradyrhizobium]|jgi:hypothetical protein|uniref:Uncharacterized protein n=1 Tax=Bradyrhizobium elkanii TaxID=29448 RepID=A0ABV4EQ06_BRAEL|nr:MULTISPECIES: hypothetical protein [Bradyrhizobium]MCP1758815.1 hypothetical protein [Bradyrhizobium elkanii]MCP1975832.1 hypothetical protein [Bradyrhizobium elkanii]MCP1985011.1 hypothetical protein [Bradyrhizobium elkanii]MCS3695238.1 hypothetical protein [Bradyrhizobium elkanii]MCS3890634.1 hypothetical protein [Bradyrhizobium elkanii]